MATELQHEILAAMLDGATLTAGFGSRNINGTLRASGYIKQISRLTISNLRKAGFIVYGVRDDDGTRCLLTAAGRAAAHPDVVAAHG